MLVNWVVLSERVVSAMLLVIAVIHLLPLVGVAGGQRLSSLYAIEVATTDLEILLRHRAVLFGLLGALCAYGAFTPAYQPIAFVAAAASIISFLVLAKIVGDYNAAINRVVVADWVAFVSLAIAVSSYAARPYLGES